MDFTFLLKISVLFFISLNLIATQDASKEISELKKKLFENYDKTTKPSNDTPVTINIFIRQISNICSKDMKYSIQLTFREQWIDSRLNYPNTTDLPYLTLENADLIWLPDIFFSNEIDAKTHNTFKPNHLIRIYNSGQILFSTRISLTLTCPMDLKYFPFDTQICYLLFASYGYTTADLIFYWKDNNPVQITNSLNLREFSLIEFQTAYATTKTNSGEYSALKLELTFKREITYFLISIFVPCAMLCFVSFTSFFVTTKDQLLKTSISLFSLITLALALVFANQNLPQVSYTKAIDIFTGVSLAFIFATFLESIIVYYKTLLNEDKNATVENSDSTNNGLANKLLKYAIDSKRDKIDCICSFVFPILFILFVIIYFIIYL